jgi:hypothetical protein
LDGVGKFIAAKIDEILAQDPTLNETSSSPNTHVNNILHNQGNFPNNNNFININNNNISTNFNNSQAPNNTTFSISDWLTKLGYPQYLKIHMNSYSPPLISSLFNPTPKLKFF